MEIRRIFSTDIGNLTAIAELYCQIWQEPPWNEFFWTVPGVLQDLQQELSLPQAICLAAYKQSRVIGFTWGYQVNQEKMIQISGGQLLNPLFCRQPVLFYIDELAVAKDMRCQGHGKGLTGKLILEVRLVSDLRICLRTDTQAAAARRVYQQLGFQDLGIKDAQFPNRTYWLLD